MARRTRAEMQETPSRFARYRPQGVQRTRVCRNPAQAGLTRGALYHHFGDKKGLLAAVVEQIDAEMDARLQAISDTAASAWEGFVTRCRAYLEMALETHIQRLILWDAKAVLGGVTPEAQRQCVESLRRLLEPLMAQGVVAQADPEALAALVYGSLSEAAVWIADGEHGAARLEQAIAALGLLLRGLREH